MSYGSPYDRPAVLDFPTYAACRFLDTSPTNPVSPSLALPFAPFLLSMPILGYLPNNPVSLSLALPLASFPVSSQLSGKLTTKHSGMDASGSPSGVVHPT